MMTFKHLQIISVTVCFCFLYARVCGGQESPKNGTAADEIIVLQDCRVTLLQSAEIGRAHV